MQRRGHSVSGPFVVLGAVSTDQRTDPLDGLTDLCTARMREIPSSRPGFRVVASSAESGTPQFGGDAVTREERVLHRVSRARLPDGRFGCAVPLPRVKGGERPANTYVGAFRRQSI